MIGFSPGCFQPFARPRDDSITRCTPRSDAHCGTGTYLDTVRPELVVPPDSGVLFLTSWGEEFSPHRLTQLVRDYVVSAETGKKGACHLFRHTMATLMLEHGADIRHIQEMLGHAELSTTQIYTQVSIRRLQAVHAATHPAERGGATAPAEREPTGPGVHKVATESAMSVSGVNELLSALAEEADAELDEVEATGERRVTQRGGP